MPMRPLNILPVTHKLLLLCPANLAPSSPAPRASVIEPGNLNLLPICVFRNVVAFLSAFYELLCATLEKGSLENHTRLPTRER
ncbi:hypothetical protein DER44DRAFT_784532 [Fusarium oxysporum]|nr:hypothetical protein DER44DRAFT_784532 [Fusarium oxysporum]